MDRDVGVDITLSPFAKLRLVSIANVKLNYAFYTSYIEKLVSTALYTTYSELEEYGYMKQL